MNKKLTWDVVLKIVIAVASAVLGEHLVRMR